MKSKIKHRHLHRFIVWCSRKARAKIPNPALDGVLLTLASIFGCVELYGYMISARILWNFGKIGIAGILQNATKGVKSNEARKP